jgi:hypothetical protein
MAAALMPGRQLLTTCASDFNFSITWRIDRTSVAGLGVFDILELPAVHKTNAFLHVLVGHELFHPLLEDFFAVEQPTVYANLRAPCAAFIKSQQAHGALFDAKRLDEMVEVGVRIWRRAVEELMCDMGCAVLFGPAAILAMSSWLLSGNLDESLRRIEPVAASTTADLRDGPSPLSMTTRIPSSEATRTDSHSPKLPIRRIEERTVLCEIVIVIGLGEKDRTWSHANRSDTLLRHGIPAPSRRAPTQISYGRRRAPWRTRKMKTALRRSSIRYRTRYGRTGIDLIWRPLM